MPNKNHDELKKILQPLIADYMKEFRKNRGWTQNHIARELKMSTRSYLYLEHGAKMSSGITLILFMSLMSEDERQSFIKNICTIAKEFKTLIPDISISQEEINIIDDAKNIRITLADENGNLTRESIIKFLDENHYFNGDYNNMSDIELLTYALKELYVYAIAQAVEHHKNCSKEKDLMSTLKAYYL